MKAEMDADSEAKDKLNNAVSNAFLVLRHNLGNPNFIVRGLTALGRAEMASADAEKETYFKPLEELLAEIVSERFALVRESLAERRCILFGDHSLDIVQDFVLKNETLTAAKGAGCWIASTEDLLLAKWKWWQVADDTRKGKRQEDVIVDLRRATDLVNFYSVLTEYGPVPFLELRLARPDLHDFNPLLADIDELFRSLLVKNKEASTRRSADTAAQSLVSVGQEPVFE